VTVAENLAPTGIRSPDRPARSESLYRLRYLGSHHCIGMYSYTHKLLVLVTTAVFLRLSRCELIPCRTNPTRCQIIHTILSVNCDLLDISSFNRPGSMMVRRNVGSIHNSQKTFFYKTSALALAAFQPRISNPCPRDKSASV